MPNKKITDLPLLNSFVAASDYRFEVVDLSESLLANQSKQTKLSALMNHVGAQLTVSFDKVTGDPMTNPLLAQYLIDLAENGGGGGGVSYTFDPTYFTKNGNQWTLNNLPQSKVNNLTESLLNKVDKVPGYGLSKNDYTDADKGKVNKLVITGNGASFLANDGNYYPVSGGGGGGTTIANGTTLQDYVKWNGTAYAPVTGIDYNHIINRPPEITLSGVITFDPNGITSYTPGSITTAAIGDKQITGDKIAQMSATSGQALVWNGTTWAPGTVAGGGGGYAPGTNTNQVLKWNGATYAAAQLQYSELGGLPPEVTVSGDVTFDANGTTTIGQGKVDTGKLANASVTVAKINATGTASATTFLRGDGQWASPPSGGGTGGATTLDGLNDVDSPVATESDILQYRSNGFWSNAYYLDLRSNSIPANPSSSTYRLFATQLGGLTEVHFKSASGYEGNPFQDTTIHCTNNSGGPLTRGQVVSVVGGSGNVFGLPVVTLAQANSANTCQLVLMSMQDVAVGATARFAMHGKIYNINTSAFPLGADLYVSPTTPGGLTATRPTGTNVIVYVGKVTNSHTTEGVIAFNISAYQDQPGTGGSTSYTDAQAVAAVGAKLTNTQAINLTHNTSNGQMTGTLNYSNNAAGTITFQQDSAGLYASLKAAERNNLLSRTSHTGEQPISTITNLQTNLNNKVNVATAETEVLVTPANAAFFNGLLSGGKYALGVGIDRVVDAVQNETLGVLFNDSTYGSLSNYSTNGTATWTVSGGNILAASGAPDFNQRLSRNYNTNLEEYTLEASYTVTALGNGLAFGVQTINPATGLGFSVTFMYGNFTGNATYSGRIITYANGSEIGTPSIASITPVVGQTLYVTLTRDKNTYTCKIRSSTGAIIQHSYTFNMAYGTTSYCNAAGRFTLWNMGGNYTIHSFKAIGNSAKKAGLLLIGDSITQGYHADSVGNRYASLLAGRLGKGVVVQAGGGNRTAEALSTISETIALKPANVLLFIGTNDLGSGVALATIQTNIQSIISQLQTAGISVGICTILPRTGIDVTGLNSWIRSTYGSSATVRLVELYNAVSLNTTDFATDLVHPNSTGMEKIAAAIAAVYGDMVGLSGRTSGAAPTGNFVTLDTVQEVTARKSFTSSTGASQLYYGITGTNAGGYLGSSGAGLLHINGGAEFTGTAWVARHTKAAILLASGDGYGFYQNTGLTAGNTYTPTRTAAIIGNQMAIGTPNDPQYNLDVVGAVSKSIARFTVGSGGLYLSSNAADGGMLTAGASIQSGAWTAQSTQASLIAMGGGETIFYGNTGLTVGSTYSPTERFRVTASGRIGNTASPQYAADFVGDGSRSIIHVGPTTGGGYFGAYGDNLVNLSSGLVVEGGVWRSKATAGTAINMAADVVAIYCKNGMTIGDDQSAIMTSNEDHRFDPTSLFVKTIAKYARLNLATTTTALAHIYAIPGARPATFQDGQLWAEADGWYTRMGGVTYKLNMTAA